MPSKKPQFVIRADKEIFDKIGYIASQNERSGTQEIVHLIKERIKEYENKNGKIIIEPTGEIHTKGYTREKSLSSKTG